MPAITLCRPCPAPVVPAAGLRAVGGRQPGVSRLAGIVGAEQSDASLVAAAAGGDRAALEDLLRRHHDRLYAVCRRVTGDDADAADATQDALMAVVRGLHRFDGRASFTTWSHRVAVNAALDELRRRRRRPVPSVDDPGGDGALAWERQAARGPDAGEAVAARLDIDAALQALPPDFRVAIVLRDLSGLSYAEIAEVLTIPVGTVRSRLSRGRDALAALLGGPAVVPGTEGTNR